MLGFAGAVFKNFEAKAAIGGVFFEDLFARFVRPYQHDINAFLHDHELVKGVFLEGDCSGVGCGFADVEVLVKGVEFDLSKGPIHG